MTCGPFFSAVRCRSGCFGDDALKAKRFNANSDPVVLLQPVKQLIQHPCVGPAAHSGADHIPFAEAFRQGAPCAARFGYMNDRVDDGGMRIRHVSALARQIGTERRILLFSKSNVTGA